MAKNYTIKEISSIAEVSTQAVYKHLKSSDIKPINTSGKTSYYSEADAFQLVKKIHPNIDIKKFNDIANDNQPVANEAQLERDKITAEYIQSLKDQLTAKDDIISKLEAERQAKDATIQELTSKYSELTVKLADITANQQELLARQQQLIADNGGQSSAVPGTVIDGDHVSVPNPAQPQPRRSFFQWLDSKFSKKK